MNSFSLGLSETEEERASELHRKALVIDGSIVIEHGQGYFDRMEKGGITASNHTVTRPGNSLIPSLKEVAECIRWLNNNREQGLLVESVADLERAKKEGKTGVILGPQDASFIGDDLDILNAFYHLGIRILQLTYQKRNLIGNGAGERRDDGLSDLGLEVIERMNRLGMVVDLSHCGYRTTDEAMEVTKSPPIFSHTHPQALSAHTHSNRTKTDDQIHALAEKGGVMGITAYSPICEIKKGTRPTLEEFLDHIDYVANLVGIQHVAVGLDIDERSTREGWEAFRQAYPEICSDYEYEARRVDGLTEISLFPNVTRGLVSRGYSDQEIFDILGENFLRVFRRVWHF
jgi:membrane dipeptidase